MNRRLRLRRPEDFARLRREGTSHRHPLLVVSVAPNSLTHNRYGFITAKRLGNAVTRNRVRRLMREAVRHLHAGLKPGYDVVIIARPHAVGKSYMAIYQALQSTFSRADLPTLQTREEDNHIP